MADENLVQSTENPLVVFMRDVNRRVGLIDDDDVSKLDINEQVMAIIKK